MTTSTRVAAGALLAATAVSAVGIGLAPVASATKGVTPNVTNEKNIGRPIPGGGLEAAFQTALEKLFHCQQRVVSSVVTPKRQLL
jgi:hypothetical protein